MSRTFRKIKFSIDKTASKHSKLEKYEKTESLQTYIENLNLRERINNEIRNLDDTNIREYLNLLDDFESTF